MTMRIAWRALLRNKIRTLLTMLGIIIGVAAVIAMLSIGNGARIAVQTRIASMGTNIEQLRGLIATGQKADLVLLDANPLEDIANSRRIGGVMLRGQWLSREDLRP